MNRAAFHQSCLAKAAQTALASIRRGAGGPFGAVIVRKGKIIAAAANTVLRNQDATCHAEINALRLASRKLGSFALNGCDVYSTTEPCPMCFSAIHWAQCRSIFYSTVISDVKKLGFNELSVSNVRLKSMGKSPVKLKRLENTDCRNLLKAWSGLAGRRTY